MIDTTVSLAVDDSERALNQALLYPLRFEPIYQYRLWGGRHLANLLTAPLPSGPIGEAWLLSDRDDHQSRVADGASQGADHRSIAASSFRSNCWESWPGASPASPCC